MPYIEEGQLLQKKPKSWDEIKDGMFLLINSQRSVTTSKLLQESPTCKAHKVKLQILKNLYCVNCKNKTIHLDIKVL